MKKLFYISALLFTFTACEKENNAIVFQGNYQGTYRSLVNDQYLKSEAAITLSDSNFTVNEGPKLGSGSFAVQDKFTVTFKDKNQWTTNFDFNMVLNGTYSYEALGDSLILTKYVEVPAQGTNYYQYRLKRVQE